MSASNHKSVLYRFLVLSIIFFSIIQGLFAQEGLSEKRNLYVYGPSIESNDASKVQVTTDIFYSQFQIDNTYALHDRRATVYSIDVLNLHSGTDDFVFYNKIVEQEDLWRTSLYLIDCSTAKEISVEYEYTEYYRILIDTKLAYSDLIAKVASESTVSVQSNTIEKPSDSSITDANLFGTWYGEEYIDKIVILRGGKGFVIFENGASMNISINIDGRTFFARQESKSNASFFPELPREMALVKALDGSLIEWELTIENENSLTGTKLTYAPAFDANGQEVAVAEKIPVKWYR